MNTTWMHEARRRFGTREDVFEYVDSPYSLWTNLSDVFKKAYTYPYNEADIRNIYEYADWSCRQPRGATAEDDLLTVVAVSFFEHLPQVPEAVKDLPRWFKFEEIIQMRDILSYQVGPDGFQKVVESFPLAQRREYKQKS